MTSFSQFFSLADFVEQEIGEKSENSKRKSGKKLFNAAGVQDALTVFILLNYYLIAQTFVTGTS